MNNQKTVIIFLLYLSIGLILLLTLSFLYLLNSSVNSLLSEIIPNIISMLIVFLFLYFFIYKRNINIEEVLQPKVNREFVNNFVAATRRIEKSVNRRAEAFESFIASVNKKNHNIKTITYKHKVLSEDIFESYRTLMEAWGKSNNLLFLYSAIEKSKEYLIQAKLHAENIKEISISNESMDEPSNDALEILIDDLSKANKYLNICSQELTLILKDIR